MTRLQAEVRIAPESLHQRILSAVEDRILSGEWPPGYRLPSELEFAAQFHCARMTVNKVLAQLAQAGLIERRRRAGSFVKRQQSESAVLEIKDIKAEVDALGLPYRHAVIDRVMRRRKRTDVAMLDVALGTPLLDLVCCHFAGPRPFCLERRLINLEAVPDAAAEAFVAIAPGAWLVARVPWTTAEHRISAASIDPATAGHLGIAVGDACLVVERRTWSADQPVTSVRLTYPAQSHALVARFAPSQS